MAYINGKNILSVKLGSDFNRAYAQDNFGNLLKGYEQGNPVRIEGTSPIEHEVSVNVDIGSATVTKYGKNLLPYPYASESQTINGVTFTVNDDGSITVNGTTTAKFTNFYLTKAAGSIPLKAGVTYAVSRPSDVNIALFALCDGTYNQGKFTWDSANTSFQVFLHIPSADKTFNNLVIYPQIEVGETSGDYEQYVEPTTYTADENGVVKGITAQGEHMTLFAENGATITAEYKRDINAVYERLKSLAIARTAGVE